MTDQFNQTMPAGDGIKTPVFDEVAIIGQQILLGNYDCLLPKDDTLLTRGGGSPEGLKIYDELLRDPKVFECHQKRVLALKARNWKASPPEGDTSRAAKKAADMVAAQLTAMSFDRLSGEMLGANIRGISAHEIMWQLDGAEIVANEATSIEPWLFKFGRRPEPDEVTFARCGVRLITPSSGVIGLPIPHRKFMFHRHDGLYNNPWGLGLGTRLFWPVFFKRQGIQFWLSFAERFGAPIPIGKYPANAQPQEKNTLKAALRAFQREASIMVPAGMDITLLEAARSGIDTYERLCRYMDDQIAGIITGQPGGAGGGGQLATAINVNNEVRLELVKADADDLTDTLRRQLASWIVAYNMPGAPVPTVARMIDEPTDTLKLAQTKRILFDMGYRPTMESIKQDFGGDYTVVSTAPNPRQEPQLLPNVADFSDPQTPNDQMAIDSLIADLSDGPIQALMQRMITPVIAAITQAKDYQGALESLVELFPNVPLDDLQKSLATAIFHVQTLGQLAAQNEAEV